MLRCNPSPTKPRSCSGSIRLLIGWLLVVYILATSKVI